MHSTRYSSSYSQEHLDYLRLIRCHNIGPATFHQLIALHGTASKAIAALPEMAKRGGSKSIVIPSIDSIMHEIDACHEFGACIITLLDPLYPALLRTIDYPPPVITVYGQTDILNTPSLAIVGARNASANGYRFAFHLAHSLAPSYTIISGLARGIDTAVHQGALKDHTTIAVTACGINITYPIENSELARMIGERGIIVTEMPYGTHPKSQNFPKRNRIISGCSLGVVVVEASLKSGSLITAHIALEQNREVFAVPGSPLDSRAYGTNQLIKQGAILVNTPQDITEVIEKSTLPFSSLAPSPSTVPVPIFIPAGEPKHTLYEQIMQKLSTSPTDINDIITQTDLTAGHILTILLELELAGKIQRYPGNKIALQLELT